MRLIRFLAHFSILFILTLTTQIGGLIWLISLLVSKRWKLKKRYTFTVLYLVCLMFIIPNFAPLFGRTALPVFNAKIQPHNYGYVLAFRNYVTPELKTILFKSANNLEKDDIVITYLDANFPFFNGFPLLPHLSHNDGNKVDIAFVYKTKDGKAINKNPSLLGYGVFTNLKNPTNDYCINKGYWQYDATKHLGFNTNPNLVLDKMRTKTLIKTLLRHTKRAKLFIEPHLKTALGLEAFSAVRFHGCQAVRHDDHIHFEIR